MTRKEKNLLRMYYATSGYTAMQFRGDELWAQKRRGGPYGLLLTVRQSRESAQALVEREKDAARSR